MDRVHPTPHPDPLEGVCYRAMIAAQYSATWLLEDVCSEPDPAAARSMLYSELNSIANRHDAHRALEVALMVLAVYTSSVGVATMLLERPGAPSDLVEVVYEYDTLLAIAASRSYSMTLLLLDNGADYWRQAGPFVHNLPLNSAIRSDKADIVQLLLRHMGMGIHDVYGGCFTPLEYAARRWSARCVCMMLTLGDNRDANIQMRAGEHMRLLQLSSPDSTGARLLLRRHPLLAALGDEGSARPFEDQTQVVKALLDAGFYPPDDVTWREAVDCAATCGNVDAARLVISPRPFLASQDAVLLRNLGANGRLDMFVMLADIGALPLQGRTCTDLLASVIRNERGQADSILRFLLFDVGVDPFALSYRSHPLIAIAQNRAIVKLVLETCEHVFDERLLDKRLTRVVFQYVGPVHPSPCVDGS